MKKKQYFLAWIVILVILGIAIAVIFNGRNKNAEENSSSKVVTVVSEEEYQFYSEVVQKDYKEQDQKELEKKTKEYAKEVYAQFALGEAYNLCKPYSYESLKMDMEAENQQRQAKKSAGEVVYGTLEYTLDSYLEYTLSNLKIQTVDYMVRNHEESLEKEAKTYWEAHPDKFERVDEITYRLGEETKTVVWDELSTLEKTDSELFEYLYYGEEGDQFTLSERDEPISGEILKKTMKTADFEADKSTVLKIYISDVYYEKLVKQADRKSVV